MRGWATIPTINALTMGRNLVWNSVVLCIQCPIWWCDSMLRVLPFSQVPSVLAFLCVCAYDISSASSCWKLISCEFSFAFRPWKMIRNVMLLGLLRILILHFIMTSTCTLHFASHLLALKSPVSSSNVITPILRTPL